MEVSKQDYTTCMKSIAGGLSFVFISYTVLTFMAIRIYGESGIKQSILDNFAADSNMESVLLRLIFLVIFLCNIPYLFYPGKSCLLSLVMEYRYSLFSQNLKQEVSSKITVETPSTDEYTFLDEELPVSDIDCFI